MGLAWRRALDEAPIPRTQSSIHQGYAVSLAGGARLGFKIVGLTRKLDPVDRVTLFEARLRRAPPRAGRGFGLLLGGLRERRSLHGCRSRRQEGAA